MNRSQARSQVATVWGYLTPMSDSEKSVRACQAASWFGAVQVGLESGRDLPALPVGDEPHRGTDQVDHTGLDRGLGPGRLDRLGKAGEPVAAHDQHVLDAPVGQLGADVRPEGGSLLGLDPDTQDVLDTVHVHPDRDVSRAGGDPVIDADLDPNRVEVDHRVELLQRAALPLQDSIGYRVGDPRNGPHAELHAERGGQVVLDTRTVIPPAHQAW